MVAGSFFEFKTRTDWSWKTNGFVPHPMFDAISISDPTPPASPTNFFIPTSPAVPLISPIIGGGRHPNSKSRSSFRSFSAVVSVVAIITAGGLAGLAVIKNKSNMGMNAAKKTTANVTTPKPVPSNTSHQIGLEQIIILQEKTKTDRTITPRERAQMDRLIGTQPEPNNTPPSRTVGVQAFFTVHNPTQYYVKTPINGNNDFGFVQPEERILRLNILDNDVCEIRFPNRNDKMQYFMRCSSLAPLLS